ncbi:MAG: ABC transporter substrate-binding protein [Micromonosporaceae bacterium]|nr:ABC transporter substrate-binding protein [Micromonosporaceae bacterium]
MRIGRALGAGAAIVALALGSGCTANNSSTNNTGNNTSTPEKITFVTGLSTLGREGYIYDAIDKGYFRDAGFDVTVQAGFGTEPNLTILQSGKAQFVTTDITAGIVDYATGKFKDFTIVASLQQRMLSATFVLANSGITTPQQLAGKKIAYIQGGTNKTLFDAYAGLAHLDAKGITWVPTSVQAMPAALATKKVDAISAFVWDEPGFGQQIKPGNQGGVFTVFPYSDFLSDLYGNGIAVTKEYAAQKPDRVRAFNKAILKGLQDALTNPQQVAQAYANHVKVEPEIAALAELGVEKGYAQIGSAPLGSLDQTRIAHSIALLQSTGMIPSAISPSDVCTFNLYQ